MSASDTGGTPEVQVRRSARRRRTVSAHREGETVVVSIPARMSRAEEAHWVGLMVARLQRSESRRRPSDAALLERAQRLSQRYLQGRAVPSAVSWSQVQRARWGSATPEDRTIRISARLRGAPRYVVDYVLLHELAHLLVPDHSDAFHALLAGYPHRDRARGFLEGVAAVANGDLDQERPAEAAAEPGAGDVDDLPDDAAVDG